MPRLFVLAPLSVGMSDAELSRVIQGVATGIGFIGGGAVLKLAAEREIHGLTTAASIWLATAAGIAVGIGRIGLAAFGVALSWVILSIVGRFERRVFAHASTAGDEAGGEAQVRDQAGERAVLLSPVQTKNE